VLKKLGWDTKTTGYRKLNRFICENSIDISHFETRPQQYQRTKNVLLSKVKYSLEDILVSGSTYQNMASLKNRLYKENLKKPICKKCGHKLGKVNNYCAYCGNKIDKDAEICLKCNQKKYKSKFNCVRYILFTIFILISLFGFYSYLYERTFSNLIIVIGFSILMLSNLVPTIYFGLLTVVIMINVLLADLLLLPKLILMFKPYGK
jgi:predicted nucleic acid-binding Zn ribbon protein